MFGLGFWEIVMIFAVILIIFGPTKLPELARGLGKGIREFRRATEDFKSSVEQEAYRPEADKSAVKSPAELPSGPEHVLEAETPPPKEAGAGTDEVESKS